MSGRLAMNNPWEVARIDREIYGDLEFETDSRENIIKEYADFCQAEQDIAYANNWHLTCNILVKPLICFFNGEWGSSEWRKVLTTTAADKKNTQQIKKVILDALEHYKTLNQEALDCRNGEKVVKPVWKLNEEEQ
jgi:tRNA-dihydrouridine synthase